MSFDADVDTDGVARGSRHTLLAQVATQVSRIAVSVVLARLLTPSDFGIVAAGMVIMVAAWQLTDLGTAAVVIQRPAVDDRLLTSLFYLNVALGLGLTVATVALARPLAVGLGQPEAEPAIRVLALACILGAVGNMHYALLRRTMQFGHLATINIASAVVSGLVGIALAVAGAGIWALVAASIAQPVVTSAMAWWYVRWHPSATFSLQPLREVARISIHFFWSNTLVTVFAQLDKIIVSRLLGGAALGTYALAQRTVASPVSAVSGAVSTVSFSAFAREQDNPEVLRSGAARAVGVVALVVLPTMVGLAVLAEQAVLVVYGSKWEAAVPVVRVLALVTAVQALSCVTASVMQAKGRTDWLYRWALAYCLVGAGVMAFAARWGLIGVSLGLAVVVFVLAPFEMKMALSLIDMRLGTYLRTLLPHVLVTGAMAGVVAMSVPLVGRAGGSTSAQLLAGVAVGAAVYAVLMWRHPVPAIDDARRVAGRWRGEDG
jgi:O-antigen/teichoic acid export membrane protein